jgi:hypothetical protein
MGVCLSLCKAAPAPDYARRKERPVVREARRAQESHGEADAGATPAQAAPPADAAAAGGATLGFADGFAERYALGRELGHGQFAVVRAARARTPGAGGDGVPDDVAVKIIPKELLRAPDAADDIRREVRARTAAALLRAASPKGSASHRPRAAAR